VNDFKKLIKQLVSQRVFKKIIDIIW